MKPDAERCAEFAQFRKIDAAFRTGDLAALLAAVGDPARVPNGPMQPAIGLCLEYAIYHIPLDFNRSLLEIGDAPTPIEHAGYPQLIAALSCSQPHPGAKARPDVAAIIRLLLSFGADPDQRGLNDYTALHMAVSERNPVAVQLLLDAGADPHLRTRIDDCVTPGEMAARARLHAIAGLLAAHETRARQ